jgi:hypothetical protein
MRTNKRLARGLVQSTSCSAVQICPSRPITTPNYRFYRDPSPALRDRDFACRLPLGVASLTPPKRLKFKSARPDQFF